MSDSNINNMNIKQLRNEVQSLRDELARMQRKYEDILYNLDVDNFSSRFTKEQGDMKTAIEVTAEGIKTKVSKEELNQYSTKTQTAEAIQNVVFKGANLKEAIPISSLEKATDTSKIYVIQEKNDSGVVISETYYYYNDLLKKWEVLSGDSIYTMFKQTPSGFAIKGNVVIDSGVITWTTSPVRTRYSSDGVTWEERAFEDGDIYMQMSFDGGETWSTPTKVVGTDGKDGADGSDGDTADVTFTAVNNALGKLFKTWSGGTPASISSAYIYSPSVKGGEFYGSVFYAGDGEGYSQMDDGGFSIYDANGDDKLGIGYVTNGGNFPYMILGIGAGYSQNGAGLVYKLGKGVWIGESSVLPYGGDYPGNLKSVQDISVDLNTATGIFIDFYDDKIYKYIKGVPTEISGGSGTNYAEFV